MSRTAAIPRRDTLPARLVTALSADELLETLRELVPDLREADATDIPRGAADGPLEELVIACGAAPRATTAARYARPSVGAALSPTVQAEALVERFGLSGRQAEVARLLAAGHSNAEIAARLGLSTFTARNHAARVLHKLGLRRRSAVGMAIMVDDDGGG